MTTTIPLTTALLLAIIGVLLAASVLASRLTSRFGVPVVLLFLLVGMLAGSEGIGGIAFESYGTAFRLGTAALALILFDGGLNTPLSAVRRVAGPALSLATAGVLLTALIVAGAARLLGLEWPRALLLGAIVSSTDAAAVFAVLRGSGLSLRRRVGTTLEVESGLNDPVAVLLTVALAEAAAAGAPISPWGIAGHVILQLVVGGTLGAAIGWGGRRMLERLQLANGALSTVLTIAISCLAYGVPALVQGSGFLAVYVAGLVLARGDLPFRTSILRVHDSLAWLAQIGMFLLLGLLVFPSKLLPVAGVGLAIAAALTLVARPLAVALCLLPFRFPRSEVLFVGWTGLRGAVPIILATYPVLVGTPGGDALFHTVFFVVVATTVVMGSTVPWLARRLRLGSEEPPAPRAVLTVDAVQPLASGIESFYIDEALAVAGMPIGEIELPEGAAPILVVRGKEMLAPRPEVQLAAGDHLYVFMRREDRGLVRLLFGRPEGEED